MTINELHQSPGKLGILVVEDELVVAEDLCQRLGKLGYHVVGAADTAADAIRLAISTKPDLTLMDIMLHGRPEGIEAAEYLRAKLNIPVIYLTAHSDSATLQRARLTDPAGYIVKPFDEGQLRAAIELAPMRHAMEQKVRHAAHWLSATLTSIGDAVVATDTHGQILLLNRAAEELTGWTQEEAEGKPCREVLRLIESTTREPIENPAEQALRLGLIIRLSPGITLITHSGEERRVEDSASPIIDEAGTRLGAVVVIVDATDREKTDQQTHMLTTRVAELLADRERQQDRNADIEVFAAAVSHDLQGPLRAIAGYSELLATEYVDQLDAAGQHFIERVSTNAQNMSSMVQDYLAFLGSTRKQPTRRTQIDLCHLARAVFSDLCAGSERNRARFQCILPAVTAPTMVWGDETLLQQVLSNLLGNALKYSSHREEPEVEFGVSPGDTFNTFFVRDNGAGMDLLAATGLFEPFQRFHSAADFPGTGVGLAIVKRILEQHGGRIWAESQPDLGATFSFSLPVHLPVEGAPT